MASLPSLHRGHTVGWLRHLSLMRVGTALYISSKAWYLSLEWRDEGSWLVCEIICLALAMAASGSIVFSNLLARLLIGVMSF